VVEKFDGGREAFAVSIETLAPLQTTAKNKKLKGAE